MEPVWVMVGVIMEGEYETGVAQYFSPLDSLLQDISTIKKAEDLAVLIPDFAEDGLSDLLTNVLHDQLNQFTSEQMKNMGLKVIHYYHLDLG